MVTFLEYHTRKFVAHVPEQKISNLDHVDREGVLVGFCGDPKAYRVLFGDELHVTCIVRIIESTFPELRGSTDVEPEESVEDDEVGDTEEDKSQESDESMYEAGMDDGKEDRGRFRSVPFCIRHWSEEDCSSPLLYVDEFRRTSTWQVHNFLGMEIGWQGRALAETGSCWLTGGKWACGAFQRQSECVFIA